MCVEIPEYVHFLLFLFAFLLIGTIFVNVIRKMLPNESPNYYK